MIFRLLCLAVVFIIASCGERHNEAFYDDILHKAERMHATGAQKAARHYLDSAYNANPNSSPHFRMLRYRDLAHWVYLESKHDTNKYFLDSQLALIKEYRMEHSHRKDYIDALNERGYVYVRAHDLNKAFEYFSRCREMSYGLGDTCSYVAHSYALGMVTYQQKRYHEAVNFFREASFYNTKCSWDIFTFFKKEEMQLNIGVSYAGLKLYDSAILYYGRALALADSGEFLFPGDTCATNFKLVANGVIKGNLARMFVALGKADTAIGLLKENIAINDKPNWDIRDAMFSRVQLSEIYFNSRRYHEMNAQLDTLQQKLQIVPDDEIRSKTLHLLYLFYREMENNTLSDLYFDRYAALNDSIEIAANDLNKIDYATQLRDRDNEYRIALLTRNNKIGNLYLGIALLSAILAVVIIFFVYRNYYRSKKNVVELTSLNKQVNEQKQALETAMSRLREANIAKDRILHIVAHDLRNPVAGIATTAQLMTMEPLTNDLKEMVELILSASDSARALIDEILEYSGAAAQTMTTEKVDINKLVEQSAALLQLKASSKGQEIKFLPSATPAYVLAHKEKMSRVLGNLLANAVKFSPHGKVIDVLLTNTNGQVKIEVRDQGIGIPADSLPHVFDLVAPPKRLGTDGEVSFGLGLSICRQIVTAHNGDIWVESVEGKGSNFHISLPGVVDQSIAN